MEPEANIQPRDKLLRDTFTPAEMLLFVLILLCANVVFWLGEPRSFWLLGFMLIAGCMTPVVLKTHEYTHPFFITFLWPKFWLCTAPVWLILLQFFIGLLQNPIAAVSLEVNQFTTFKPANTWLPTTTESETKWFTVVGFAATYIITVNLFIVPKSRAFFERLMPWLCLSAALVALFGYLQAGLALDNPVLTQGTGRTDFFAFFPYDGHWAAFAAIWCCVSISMALLLTRYDDAGDFLQSPGPWYVAAGVLLGCSAFWVEAHWPAIIQMLSFAFMLSIFAIRFLKLPKQPHRFSIVICSAMGSVILLVFAAHRFIQPTKDAVTNEALRQAATEMFTDSPIFGWGIESYSALLPFYASDLLIGNSYERTTSDILQILAETGFFGIIIFVALIATLIIRYLRGRRDLQLTNHLLFSGMMILLLAFCDSPFMSPAVFFSFFVVFFTALRWADITRNKVDEVDAPRPSLVTSESKRSVPFYTGPRKDRFV